MAINNPGNINTNIDNFDYAGPQQKASIGNISNAIASGLASTNSEQNEKLKALLQGKQNTADLASALGAAKEGRSVKVGDASVGVDPNAQNQKKLLKSSSDEATKLNSVYGKHASDLEGAASQVESGLTGLNEGTPQGDKTAIAALTRLADGKGQRMTQAQLASMTPDSAQGSAEKMMNYWQGAAETGLAPSQRAAINNLLKSHAKRLQSEFSDTQNEFKEQAPFLAPTMAQSGQLNQYVNTFGNKGNEIFNRIGKLSEQPSGQAQPAMDANKSEGLVPKSAGLLSGLKGLLFGNSPAANAQSSQPQQQSPQAPTGFDPDSYLKGQ